MSRGTILLAVLWALAVLHARAQRETYTWDDFISEYTADEEQAEDEQWTLWLEELKDIHEQPMNINTASVDDLQRLPFLNTAQIEQIHAYIYLHGAMQTLGELRLIPLLDQATRQRLSPSRPAPTCRSTIARAFRWRTAMRETPSTIACATT